MTNDEPISISITLSPAQIDEVVRAASSSRAPSISTLIADSLATPLAATGDAADTGSPADDAPARRPRGGYMPNDTTDRRLSRSLLRGLALLTGFGPEGEARGIVELAGDLGMSPSTAHRYALTLVELGLLERCPKTRKYRLPGT
ncbi:MAG TPA: helix-turn-helix domain-containing protein [Solirubrobacteraceae bacterium]|nr:helix-turn-helix domain-containing protein [Solirubrobacteraceae bacterium]